MKNATFTLLGPSLFALATTLAACGGASQSAATPQDRAAQERANADARLRGTWRFVEFRPDVQLEPFLQMWLDQQKNSLVVTFHDGLVTAKSATIAYERPYQLTEVYGGHFTFTSPGNSGVPYTSTGDFSPDGRKIMFRTETDPLRGSGLLERIGN